MIKNFIIRCITFLTTWFKTNIKNSRKIYASLFQLQTKYFKRLNPRYRASKASPFLKKSSFLKEVKKIIRTGKVTSFLEANLQILGRLYPQSMLARTLRLASVFLATQKRRKLKRSRDRGAKNTSPQAPHLEARLEEIAHCEQISSSAGAGKKRVAQHTEGQEKEITLPFSSFASEEKRSLTDFENRERVTTVETPFGESPEQIYQNLTRGTKQNLLL